MRGEHDGQIVKGSSYFFFFSMVNKFWYRFDVFFVSIIWRMILFIRMDGKSIVSWTCTIGIKF